MLEPPGRSSMWRVGFPTPKVSLTLIMGRGNILWNQSVHFTAGTQQKGGMEIPEILEIKPEILNQHFPVPWSSLSP